MHYRKKWVIYSISFAILAWLIVSIPAFAITTEEVEQQVASQGKEIATGNVLVWFLCAVAFLKVSQKIDSFMSSLGINVGKTGGSLLAETMIAGRAITKGFSGTGFGGRMGSNFGNRGTSSEMPLAGGLSGTVGRMLTNSAAEHITGQKESVTSTMAKAAYDESIKSGGSFASNVISSIATGEIAKNGSITGQEAIEAFQSYMGVGSATEDGVSIKPALDGQNEFLPIADSVQDSIDTTNAAQRDDALTENTISNSAYSLDSSFGNEAIESEINQTNPEFSNTISSGFSHNDESLDSSISSGNASASGLILNGNHQTANEQMERNDISMTNSVPNNVTSHSVASNVNDMELSEQHTNSENRGGTVVEMQNGNSSDEWLSDSPLVGQSFNNELLDNPVTGESNIDSISGNATIEQSVPSLSSADGYSIEQGVTVGEMDSKSNYGIEISDSSLGLEAQAENHVGVMDPKANYSNMEIGGSRITGVETSSKYPEGIAFAMYQTDKYAEPDSKYNILKSVDGTKWYHQYARNAVEKEPYMKEDGKIGYKESIVKKLPPAPKRKERL